ncbi:MAG: T9SS type A sorting domain-containing protein [Candidatus Margulisbacteria bacterium]|jgi:flagellar hook assembly protein FlgD|nr:T9SS type A sorting domain-containing protein [Candidatus Margulisiibacteriota bacterium]
MKRKLKYIFGAMFLAGMVCAAVPTDNAVTFGLNGDAIYSWERSGFLIGNQPVYLPPNERLAENPQVIDLTEDENLYLLIHTIDQMDRHRIYKEYFLETEITLGAPVYDSLSVKTLKEYFSSTSSADIKEAELNYSSILGRLPVFRLSENIIKKYGDLYHFGEDTQAPGISLESNTIIFSPYSADPRLRKSGDAFCFYDDHSDFAVDVRVDVRKEYTGELVYTQKYPYSLIGGFTNFEWDGLTSSGVTADEGWYYLEVSGTDEVGNYAAASLNVLYMRTKPLKIENFNYTILNTAHPGIVMNSSPKIIFSLATQENTVSINTIHYQITLFKQENASFVMTPLMGIVTNSVTFIEKDIRDEYGYPLEDGFYTAVCELVDEAGIYSNKATVNFEVNREPILAVVAKEQNVFTPHNTGDNYPDIAEFGVILQDRGVTIDVPYSYQILSDRGETVISRPNYTGDKIVWDGKDGQGKYWADGLYKLLISTEDDIGNRADTLETIIKTRVPVKFAAPLKTHGNNMVALSGTVVDPGGSTAMDFERFEIFFRTGEHTDFALSGNIPTALDTELWQAIAPLPDYMNPQAADFPETLYGVRTAYQAKLAFWQPETDGVYTLLMRVRDKEGFVAIDAQTVNVTLARRPTPLDLVSPLTGSSVTINSDRFVLKTEWDTRAFENFFTYEMNVYSVSGEEKTKIIRHVDAQPGNMPNAVSPVLWDGKDQYRKYVESGAYIIEVFFYDLNANSFARQELRVSVNNFYDEPLMIKRFEAVDAKILFVNISEPADCVMSIYNGQNKVYKQDFNFSGSELELALPELPAGFYRINLQAVAVGNEDDQKDVSLALILNQELATDGAQLNLPTGNIEPRHYFGFEAERTGVFYPEITGNITLKLSVVRDKYVYDPYTLFTYYNVLETWWKYSYVTDPVFGYSWGYGDKVDEWASWHNVSQLRQQAYLNNDYDRKDYDTAKWTYFSSGVSWVDEGGKPSYHIKGQTSGKGVIWWTVTAYYKGVDKRPYYSDTISWKNVIHDAKRYAAEPTWQQLNADLPQMVDRFYLPRGEQKSRNINFASARPDYEKVLQKTFWHPAAGRDLEHVGWTTITNNFGISHQIEYDEQAYINTSILSLTATSDMGEGDITHLGHNYLTINMLIDNFAVPEQEQFDLEITLPLKDLYKGHDFYSGDLGALVDEIYGQGTQEVYVPYIVTTNTELKNVDVGDVTVDRFIVEIPISINTTILSSEIVSTLDSRVQAKFVYVDGKRQLLVTTEEEQPWTSDLDANLRSGKLRGLVVYDPVHNAEIKFADYYPADAINRATSMYFVKDGLITLNPQVQLTGSWNITLRDITDLTLTHNALAVNAVYASAARPLGDHFTVQLSPLAQIDAYLPVYGWIADDYRGKGYYLYIRPAHSAIWTHDSYHTAYPLQDFTLRDPGSGYLLGFAKVSNFNDEHVLRLVASGAQGAAETIANIALGRKVTRGAADRVYAYDYRSWLDIYPDSLLDPQDYYITLTPRPYSQDDMNLPPEMADPFGPIYNMQPHGLIFNPDRKPLLTSLIYNPNPEQVDLARLVVYHLDKDNQLGLAEIYSIDDADHDGILRQNETGSLASFVEGFSSQFYVPALRKLAFKNYEVYASAPQVTLQAVGSPTANLEGFLDGDLSSAVITDKTPDTASGDYNVALPDLTEGAHVFVAREYQYINTHKSSGPLSEPVNIVIDLQDPTLIAVKTSSTLNQLELEFTASEKSLLHVAVAGQSWAYPAARGMNQQTLELNNLPDGYHAATVNLVDLAGRTSNVVTVSVLIDRTPPQGGSIVFPRSGQRPRSLFTLEYIAPEDEMSGLRDLSAEYAVTADQWLRLVTLDASEVSRNIYIPAAAGAPYALRLSATDIAGNIWYSPSVNITVTNNYAYTLNELSLLPLVSANIHQVAGLVIAADLADASTELYILTDPSDTADLSWEVTNSVGATIDIATELPVVYLIGRRYGQFTNAIPIPVKLPYFTQSIYPGDSWAIEWPEPGQITYKVNGDQVSVYYQPLGSELIYLADTVVVKPAPQIDLVDVSSEQVLLYRASDTQYLYKPQADGWISLNYVVSAPEQKTITFYPQQDTATKTVQAAGQYTHTLELDAAVVTVAAQLKNANTATVFFWRDTVCYPVTELAHTFANSRNVLSWTDVQTDIAQYQLTLYRSDNGVEIFDRSLNTSDKQWGPDDLAKNTFYRLAVQSRDQLGNISLEKSIVFYSSPARLLTVNPLHFTQFTDKAAGLAFAIGTFAEEVLYAYQEYAPCVITGDVYLYQSYNLQPSKLLTPAYPVTYYFDVPKLEQMVGGDKHTCALYYYKNDIWQPVPDGEYVYDPDFRRYTYTGGQFYPLAIGAQRLAKWFIEGVGEHYAGNSVDIDLTVYAKTAADEVATQSTRLKVLSSNAEILTDIIFTNTSGYGVLPIRLGDGREKTYSVLLGDDTGVTGGITFYADYMASTFNALILDGWQRVTSSVTLNEGTKYLMELDVDAYPGAELEYSLSDYINLVLGNKKQFVFRPEYTDAGQHQLNIRVGDGEASSRTHQITINVLNTNRQPFIQNNGIIYVPEMERTSVALNGVLAIIDFDEDDALQDVSINNVPLNFTVQRLDNSNVLAYTAKPDYDQQGTHDVTVVLSDGQEITTENIRFVVQNVNRPAKVKQPYREVPALQNQLVTFSLDIVDPDGDPVTLDFAEFPFSAGTLTANIIDATTTRLDIWARPGFESLDNVAYTLLVADGIDVFRDQQKFLVKPDVTPPQVFFAKAPSASTYVVNYPFLFKALDNVWSTFNIEAHRDGQLIWSDTQTTENIVAAPTLVLGQNDLRFVFRDGAGNTATMQQTITLENISGLDPNTGIYVEIPVGAYNINAPTLLATQNIKDLTALDWQISQLPYAIGKFSDLTFLAVFDPNQLAVPLEAGQTLNVPAKFVVKLPKTVNDNQKYNPVIWDNERQQWLAHTAKRLTPEEFGELSVPTAAFNLGADEELVYFESPRLGLIQLMLFETAEYPQIRLAHPDDYYDTGENAIFFTLKGNFLRLENTFLWFNEVTLNARLPMDSYMDNTMSIAAAVQNTGNALISYEPERGLFVVTVNSFQQGNNVFKVAAENLVHQTSTVFALPVQTTELEVREVYAYPNPAREQGEQMIRFSCILSKPADINIRIYTNQGHLVKELTHNGQTGFNAVPWNGKDRYDNQTANGMYLYVITFDDGDKKIIQRKKVGILL